MYISRFRQKFVFVTILCLGLASLIAAADQDRCLFRTNCRECLATSGCGWCDGHCLAGDTMGPSGFSAACPIWLYGSNTNCTLPGSSCKTFNDCFACTKQSGCGWCKQGGTSSCTAGNSNGPNTDQCTAWTWSVDLCNNPLDCTQHTNCRACLQDSSLMCGWCDTTNTCMVIEEVPKKSAHVPADKRVATKSCPRLKIASCDNTCYELGNDCQACLLQQDCGWCPSQSSCLKGTTDGPKYLNNTDACHAADWKRVTCTVAPRCEQLSGCTDCTAQAGCYWCANIGCSSQNSEQCCSTCAKCRFNRAQYPLFTRVSIILLTACATAMTILLVTAIVYSFYYYYWSRRHYFEVLE